jgi:hypothetical protein
MMNFSVQWHAAALTSAGLFWMALGAFALLWLAGGFLAARLLT